MKKFMYGLSIIGYISFAFWGGCRFYKNIQFGLNCEKFLNIATDATILEDAMSSLSIAIAYCENNDLMSGSTSIIYSTVDDDIGIWYRKLKTSFAFLNSTSSTLSAKEKTLVLKKFRTALVMTDDTGKTKVICPKGISIYPYNRRCFLWVFISILIIVISEYILTVLKEHQKS